MPQQTQYNMLSSLVGVDPGSVTTAQYGDAQQSAAGLAGMDPRQASAYMMGMGGVGLAPSLAQLIGLKNPALADAQASQGIQQAGDNSTPEGLLATAARFNKVGNTQMALKYTQAAQALHSQNIENNLHTAQTAKALSDANAPADPFSGVNTSLYTPKSLQKYRTSQDMGDLELRPDLVNKNSRAAGGTGNPFSKINPKDYTPESLSAFIDSGDVADLVAIPKPAGGGMGGARNVQMSKRVMTSADLATAGVENLMKLPVESSTGFFGGRTNATGLTTAPFNALVNSATSQSVQDYNATLGALKRNLAGIEATGFMPNGTLTNMMDSEVLKDGDTNFTKMRKMANIRQIIQEGLSAQLDDPSLPTELKDHMTRTIDRVKKAIPFTVDDVNNLQRAGQKNPSATLASLYANQPSATPATGAPVDLQSAAAAEIARRRGGR